MTEALRLLAHQGWSQLAVVTEDQPLGGHVSMYHLLVSPLNHLKGSSFGISISLIPTSETPFGFMLKYITFESHGVTIVTGV